MDIEEVKDRLKSLSQSEGGRLFGVCRVDDLREQFHAEIRQSSERLNYAISVGIPLSVAVMDTLTNHPNMLYKTHYRQINHTLNDIAFKISSEINKLGFESIPIPASQMIKWKPMRAHLSHREIAFKAGLGWRGRNNLLVNKKYGSQVRLVTILTDLDLPTDRPVETDCGDCYACLEACPVGAISEEYEDFNLDSCRKKVSEFARPENIGTYICGLCLQACPGEQV